MDDASNGFKTRRLGIALGAAAIIIASYYWIQMHTFAPWYDELYSLKTFALNGMRYTATHWPLPNNHVLYNVLAALVSKLTPDKLIIMRGISYASLLATTAILYAWLSRAFDRTVGVATAALFALGTYAQGFGVQGRGYSLAMLLFTLALVACSHLSQGDTRRRWYVLWTASIALAVYDVPSNLYWILLLFAGTVPFMRRDLRATLAYCASCAVGAVLAFCAYLPIWLTTAREAAFAGTLLESIAYGMKQMLSNQYVQSIDRATMLQGLPAYVSEVGGAISFGFGCLPLVLAAALLVAALAVSMRRNTPEGRTRDDSFHLLVKMAICLFGIFAIITLQSALPYTRTLCFLGVAFPLAIAVSARTLAQNLHGRRQLLPKAALAATFCMLAVSFFGFQTRGVFAPLSDPQVFQQKDASLQTIFTETLANRRTDNIVLGDEYSALSCFYYWDVDKQPGRFESDAETVILDDREPQPGYEKTWPSYFGHADVPWNSINANMDLVYRDSAYSVYVRRDDKS